ncbi:mediator of RNA polymerase II transcription subunit 14 [Diaporthe helianthi]|uniref:Mediator of RNA polymerase II transcription subunit 14 n=1 Tax=Diaporthe helianthi TaxID=158607 RepID=A0A2P5HR55_DIAHE|nr:mediator of RNA polymerase II transcription subunit 14 [Diaporthe helianthi]
MEIGTQNGARTDHDRDSKMNGINGAGMVKREPSPNKAKGGATPMTNGYDTPMESDAPKQAQAASSATDQASKMDNLPPEIAHITQNFIGIPFLLQRLAQKSHNDLQSKIEELSKMLIPQGSLSGNAGTAEDNSEENQNKKANLLHFIQDMHGKWVKALVISEWSRKAGQVSKLIDLNVHINEQLAKYDQGLDFMGHIKRGLYQARLPDPDLKTALQALSTGQAPWFPEFGYIEPPPLTTAEQIKWINELNTLLSVRLNLEDHDKIPCQFRDYTIDSGRVTFKVDGEFEVDLTIADEDFEKQFWFIDFRFTFSPAPQDLTETLRMFLEMKVNEALGTDGLRGCYELLHELTLTHKINELGRQAVQLSRGRWIENLKVERLNRALSIQYWTNRFPTNSNAGPKSWIVVGVNSGRTPKQSSPQQVNRTSHLELRWFQDGKEVRDVDVAVENQDISAEALIKKIIAKHVGNILSSIYDKLLSKPRFEKRQASISLSVDSQDPSDSALVVQLTHAQSLTVRINPTTGMFNMEPAAQSYVYKAEAFLNQRSRNLVEDGVMQIETIRWQSEFGELIRLGQGQGWHMSRRPVGPEEVKRLHASREPHNMLWLKREGWAASWYLVVYLSLAGDTWWLVEIDAPNNPTEDPPRPRGNQFTSRNNLMAEQSSARLKSFTPIPITSTNPRFSVPFFTDLTTLTTGMIAQISDMTTLRKSRIPYSYKAAINPYLSSRTRMPSLFVRFASILPPQAGDRKAQRTKESWAGEFVEIMFRGVRNPESASSKYFTVSADVKVLVRDKSKFSLLKGHVDHDVYYHARTGSFRLHLRTEIGKSFIDALATRLKALDRLVEFVAAINRRSDTVKCESVTLRKVVFTYGVHDSEQHPVDGQASTPWRVVLDLARSEKVSITLEKGNPHIRVRDMLDQLVNSPAGFEQLPFWLQTSLNLHRALDAMEDSWVNVAMDNQGELQIAPRAIDAYYIYFELSAQANKPAHGLCLRVRCRPRRGELWWSVERAQLSGEAPRTDSDEFDVALQPVFDSKGDGWMGHGKSAVAKTAGTGIVDLLVRVSDALKGLATGGAAQPAAGSQGAAIVLD